MVRPAGIAPAGQLFEYVTPSWWERGVRVVPKPPLPDDVSALLAKPLEHRCARGAVGSDQVGDVALDVALIEAVAQVSRTLRARSWGTPGW